MGDAPQGHGLVAVAPCCVLLGSFLWSPGFCPWLYLISVPTSSAASLSWFSSSHPWQAPPSCSHLLTPASTLSMSHHPSPVPWDHSSQSPSPVPVPIITSQFLSPCPCPITLAQIPAGALSQSHVPCPRDMVPETCPSPLSQSHGPVSLCPSTGPAQPPSALWHPVISIKGRFGSFLGRGQLVSAWRSPALAMQVALVASAAECALQGGRKCV